MEHTLSNIYSGSVVVFSISFQFIPVHSRFLRGFVCKTEYFLIANSTFFEKFCIENKVVFEKRCMK